MSLAFIHGVYKMGGVYKLFLCLCPFMIIKYYLLRVISSLV